MTAKAYRLGTHRVCPPELTWERIAPFRAHFGVTRVADLTGLDGIGMPVFQAVRPASRNLSVSQGKGVTEAAARVSALMEALELWHAESLEHLPRERSSPRDMQRTNPIPADAFRRIPGAPPLEDLPLDWVRLEPLTGREAGFLPRQMLELDFTSPDALEPALFQATSNGLASGNCLEEALLHGLCEWVERHALQQSRTDPRRKVPLDAARLPSPEAGSLWRRIAAAGMKGALFQIGWEDELPVLLAEIVADDLPVVWRGSGCHPSREVALLRALTEAAQSRLTYIAGARDDLVPLAPGLLHRVDFEQYRAPEPRVRFEELPDRAGETVQEDLNVVLRALRERGHDAYGVQITRPDLGLPAAVAFTFVTGLEEIRA